MRVTAEVKVSTQQSIRKAARRLFARRGVQGTSTRDIAEAAKIAVGTLFNYFPSKEALAVAIAAESFAEGSAAAGRCVADGKAGTSLDEELFTLIASDLRALADVRSFVGEVLEAGFSPFASSEMTPEAAFIRGERLEDAANAMTRHGAGAAITDAVLHLYWSLYLGVLSFWCRDESPNQEDTLALLDQALRMFTSGVARGITSSGAATRFGDTGSTTSKEIAR